MKMYVANVSPHAQEFTYRLPERPAPRTQFIGLGRQIQISGDLTSEEIASIVEQHAPYGMVAAQDVGQARAHVYLIYSVGKPTSAEKMSQALERNLFLMGEQGLESRKTAALAVDSRIAEMTDRPDLYRSLEMTVTEERRDGGLPSINEKIVVDREQGAPRDDRGGRRGNRRRAA